MAFLPALEAVPMFSPDIFETFLLPKFEEVETVIVIYLNRTSKKLWPHCVILRTFSWRFVWSLETSIASAFLSAKVGGLKEYVLTTYLHNRYNYRRNNLLQKPEIYLGVKWKYRMCAIWVCFKKHFSSMQRKSQLGDLTFVLSSGLSPQNKVSFIAGKL